MFGMMFVRNPTLITYLCDMYLIITFKILEYQLIYLISEFSYSDIGISIDPKIPVSVGHYVGPYDFHNHRIADRILEKIKKI